MIKYEFKIIDCNAYQMNKKIQFEQGNGWVTCGDMFLFKSTGSDTYNTYAKQPMKRKLKKI